MEIETHLTEKAQRDLPIVKRAQSGEQSAFNELMERYKNSVQFMVQKMIRNADDVEDITIDTFGKAFSNINNYTPEYAFSTWLFKIATNRCIDHVRKKRVETLSIDNTFDDGDENYRGLDLPSANLNPEEETMQDQKKKIILAFVDKLKPNYKILVEKRYFEELSYDEIAEELDLPLGTVKAQLFRARDFLAKYINESSVSF